MLKRVFFISGTLITSWLFFEYIMNSKAKKNLRKQIKFFLKDNEKNNFYYSRNNNSFLEEEISKVKSSEKIHMLFSFKNTFKFKNDDMDMILHNIYSYKNIRENIHNEKLINYTEWNMVWYPYLFRILFSCLNNIFLIRYKNLTFERYNKLKIYRINKKENNKNIVIFLGLGGIIFPFSKVIDFFIENNYNIIIPLYGPSQASLEYNLNITELDYYKDIINFLKSENIEYFSILSWSLGGILYKGFHNYITKYNLTFNINCVYLLEPLICMRACMDTFFSHRRNYNDTFQIMDSVTSKRYSFYNTIFSYFLHTIVGFGTAHSLGYFTNVETKINENIKYPRYLFISSDDVIINNKLDKEYIKNNYNPNNIYFRRGYHGGWINSSKLIPILDEIVN